MNLHLVNEYSSLNLGDAVIYETIAQLGVPYAVRSALVDSPGVRVRGLQPPAATAPGDLHVSVGGDIFNNGRPTLVSRRFLGNLRDLASRPGERTLLFGQTIPASCRGLALHGLAYVLRRLSSVTVRDRISLSRLRAMGVAAELSHDLAFGYRTGDAVAAAGSALFERAGIDAGRCVLLSVRDFDAMYPVDRADFQDRMAELALRLLQRGHQPAVLIQAISAGADSDPAVAAELCRRVPGLVVLNPFEPGSGHSPIDAAAGAIAQANAVVAVRYHTAVLRLLAGRQPYSLHYSLKGEDLASRLGLAGQALAGFDPAQAVAAIEASADRPHDPRPQRDCVRGHFAMALERAAGRTPARAGQATGTPVRGLGAHGTASGL